MKDFCSEFGVSDVLISFQTRMNFEYPEIEALNELWVKHQVMIKVDRSDDLGPRRDYPLVDVKMGDLGFSLFVDDEYEDFRLNYPLLNFCLVLRELEGYQDSPDFDVWCQERFFDSKDEKIKQAFEHLKDVVTKVEALLGTIDSQVSDWDFEMNAGAAQALRRSD